MGDEAQPLAHGMSAAGSRLYAAYLRRKGRAEAVTEFRKGQRVERTGEARRLFPGAAACGVVVGFGRSRGWLRVVLDGDSLPTACEAEHFRPAAARAALHLGVNAVTLTAEQVAALTERLQAGAPRLLCRWCGGDVVVLPETFVLPLQGEPPHPSALPAPGAFGLPLAAARCDSCGHVALFDATLAGLV